jgi:hypothetical protein
MDGKNMNEIMKSDPSTRNGEYSKAFEKSCLVNLQIVEKNIVEMVGQEKIQSYEYL